MEIPKPDPSAASRILIVEDDDEIRGCLMLVMQDAGYVTDTAAGLTEARSALARNVPSVMLLDLMLAGESGRDLLAELLPRGEMPPTVLVSASRDAPGVAKEFGLRLVPKPFDIDELVDTVRTLQAG